jgi:hypothetical protein
MGQRSVGLDTSVNGTWWYDSGFGFPLGATYFQFVNIEAERALRAAGLRVDPTIYSDMPFNLNVPGAHYYTRVLSRRFRRQLLQVVPADDRGRPYFPGLTRPKAGDVPYFDTTDAREIMARTIGFNGQQVRHLKRRGVGGTETSFEELSNELVHVGGVSDDNRASQLHDDSGIKLRFLLADHVALLGATDRLPDSYGERQRSVAERLGGPGLDGGRQTAPDRRAWAVRERGGGHLRPPARTVPSQ